MLAGVLLLALPFCSAETASSYAGSAVVAPYPPPGATANPAIDSYFPDASQVGYQGPTPSQSCGLTKNYTSILIKLSSWC